MFLVSRMWPVERTLPKIVSTECVTNLDLRSEMIIFVLILTRFEASFDFFGSCGISKYQLEPKT